MQNIGTKAGPLIPQSDGLIAGDPTSNNTKYSMVSDFGKSYGTFSGADIKVVVHYPFNIKKGKELQRLKDESFQNLQAEQAWFSENRTNISAEELLRYNTRIQAINAEFDSYDKAIENLKYAPTSKVLAEIQSLSWSTHRDKSQVRFLGSVYPRGITRGPRSIAGTMIFTIFHEHVFHEIMALNLRQYNTGTSDYDKFTYTTMLIDQLPPVDISMVFANEYGAISHMGLFGVEFFQEGGTFSVQDIYSENVIHYIARDIDPMRLVSQRAIDGQGMTDEWSTTASDMLLDNSGHIKRRNPFI